MNHRKRTAVLLTALGTVMAIGAGGYIHHVRDSGASHIAAVRAVKPGLVNHQHLTIQQGTQRTNDPNHAKAMLVMNDKTGDISYAKNIDKRYKVASTAKLMTLYLVQRKATLQHAWNHRVTISQGASRMSNDKYDGTGSEWKLQAGQKYSVSDLYKSALVESSDSAAIALGQWVANGSNADFVKLMNKQAKAWNLKAHFISASGLENDSIKKFGFKVSGGKTSGNMLSAKDLAIITRHLLHDFPQITKWSSQPSMTIHGVTVTNLNNNLPTKPYYAPGCDGLKTGFTPSAGYCFVGTRKQGHSHKIVVIINDMQVFKDSRKAMK